MEYITDAIYLAKRRINTLNWSAAQTAFLFYCANQDPEKPGSRLDVVDFLPYPEAAKERTNKLSERLSKATKQELMQALNKDWLGPKLSLTLYSVMR